MNFTELMPVIAGILLLGFSLRFISSNAVTSAGWKIASVLCAAFLAWSLWAVWEEGLFGFWPVHTISLWGNQVWFDLLIAIGIGWFLIQERAIAQSMNRYLWLVVILATGCIGFLAMISRLLYLENQNVTLRS